MITLRNTVSIDIELGRLVNACSESELRELIMLAEKRLRQTEYQNEGGESKKLPKGKKRESIIIADADCA